MCGFRLVSVLSGADSGPAAKRLGVLLGDETTDLEDILESGEERIRGLLGEGLIDQAFVAGAKLIVILLIGLLVTLSAYRYLAGRIPMTATTRKGSAT